MDEESSCGRMRSSLRRPQLTALQRRKVQWRYRVEFQILHPTRHRRDETLHADSAFRGLSQRLKRAPEEIVKLDANENPYGPSPKAREALANAAFLNIYPDPDSTFLREALAKFTGVPKERLFPGAGADELIDLVLRATITPGDVVINCPPSFGMYPLAPM